MNCDTCHDLISELLDGSLSHEHKANLNLHLEECLDCAGVRDDLQSIVGFCRTHRGEYTAPPNEKALWQRIRNVIEADASPVVATAPERGSWRNWIGRSWELSFPQLVASVAVIVLVVALSTAVALRRYQTAGAPVANNVPSTSESLKLAAASVRERVSQQQQMISYWNQRVEYNKARWSPEMRETFERNLKVIDQTVNDQFDALSVNPHDEVSEEILNSALNEKLSLLKEFAEL